MITFDLDTSDWKKKLNSFEKYGANIGVRLMRKVNQEVIKEVKKTAKSRGYSAHKLMSFGDAGYQKNIFHFENKDLTAKLMFGKNAFHYRFIEYGANVMPRKAKRLVFVGEDGQFHSTQGFRINPRPILSTTADYVWNTKGSKIMDQQLQKELDKLIKKGIIEVEK